MPFKPYIRVLHHYSFTMVEYKKENSIEYKELLVLKFG